MASKMAESEETKSSQLALKIPLGTQDYPLLLFEFILISPSGSYLNLQSCVNSETENITDYCVQGWNQSLITRLTEKYIQK